MRPVVYICINGIKTRPGRDDGWTDRAVTELMLGGLKRKLPVFAEKYEYFTLATTRRFRQQARAEAIADLVHRWHLQGALVSLFTHSNGGDLGELVIDLCPDVPLKSVHFFASASDGDILKRAIENGQIGHAYLHGQTNDPALKLGRWSRRLLKRFGLGYGDLGLRTKTFADSLAHTRRVTADESGEGDHSHWFKADVFEQTISQVLDRDFPTTKDHE